MRALASGGSPPNEVSSSVTTSGDGSTLPPTNYPPGFRRARAGTLPSNVQLAAQRFAAASNTLGSTPASTESLIEQSQRQLPAAPTPSLAGAPARPGLRHTTSVASAVAPPVRLRSGSLTLPTGGLSNAFGPSIFSSSWLSSTNGNGSGFPVLDELKSVTSADSADDFDVHTLDYLGLDDRPRQPPAATISELRNQAQAAIAGNLANPSRMRATTVSNPYRTRPSAPGSLLATPAAEEDEEYFDNYDEHAYGRQHLSPYEASTPDGAYSSSYIPKGFKQADHLASRPRAISVGNLDDPIRTIQRRATIVDTGSYLNDFTNQNSGLAVITNNLGNPAGILRSDKMNPVRGGASPTVHFPGGELSGRASSYLVAPGPQNRSLSPKSEGPSSSQIQTPTRSLWIGNLDSAVTSEQLIHVFAPYGAIESLRLLPEKVCLKFF